MCRRGVVLTLAVLLAAAHCAPGDSGAAEVTGVTRTSDGCSSSSGNDSACCFVCPEIPPCPSLPEIPACPSLPQIPACPSFPEISTCPVFSQIDERQAEIANQSATHQVSRELTCPECPTCPDQAPSASGGTAVSRALPEGYEVVYGIRPYKTHLTRKAFYAANWTCQNEGGYLATPSTQAEMNAILSLMSAHGLTNAHSGFHKSIPGRFIRVTGEEMDSLQFKLWAANAPNSEIDYNCTYINLPDQKLRSERCTDKEFFICQL